MEYAHLAKKAWHTAWRYRALWILGIVLAFTTTSWSVPVWTRNLGDGSSGGNLVYVLPDDSRIVIPGGDHEKGNDGGDLILNYKHQADDWPYRQGDGIISYSPPDEFSVAVVSVDQNGQLDLKTFEIRPGLLSLAVALGVGLMALLVLLLVATTIARYVAETALIQMVDEYQETGQRRSTWQGIRIGWSRSAWRLFVINLVVSAVGLLAGILLFGAILAPLPLWVQGGKAVIFLSAFVTGSFFFLALALVVLGRGVLYLFRRIAWRACIVEDLGVLAAVARAYRVVRSRLKELSLLWLISFALRLGWCLVLIPTMLALVGVALLTGSLPALLAGELARLVTSGALPVFVALGVGIPIFLVVLLAPLVLLSGVREVFLSSLWTLSYRDLVPLGSRAVRSRSGPDESGLEATPVAS